MLFTSNALSDVESGSSYVTVDGYSHTPFKDVTIKPLNYPGQDELVEVLFAEIKLFIIQLKQY